MKGLFVNNSKAQDSIYESGVMVYNCVRQSSKYELSYIEVAPEKRTLPLHYDFYFFNYHPVTMDWLDTSQLHKMGKLIMTIILEVSSGDPFIMCPRNHFHGYCVLDPTINGDNNTVFSFPRPLEVVETPPPHLLKIPVIGSFGFATKGKGFQHVIEAVNREFDEAIVRLNIPYGNYVANSKDYALFLGDLCKNKAKNGIKVIVTHEYMDKADLINWCAANTLNCFLYDRNIPGLSATTDQAIVSERPMVVSNNPTFRHILQYMPPYPERSLLDAIAESTTEVVRMKSDWSPSNFLNKYEEMLHTLQSKTLSLTASEDYYTLPLKEKGLKSTYNRITKKMAMLTKKGGLQKTALYKKIFGKDEELI